MQTCQRIFFRGCIILYMFVVHVSLPIFFSLLVDAIRFQYLPREASATI